MVSGSDLNTKKAAGTHRLGAQKAVAADKRDKLLPQGRVEKVELEGNPNAGEVVFIRQIHDRPGLPPDVKQLIGQYQFRILQELTDRKVKDVFAESLYEDIVPGDPRRNDPKGMIGAVKKIFPNGVPSEPNPLQLNMLTNVGACSIYAYLNPDVTLHRTYANYAEYMKIDAEIKRWSTSPKGMDKAMDIVLNKREELATRELMAFLKQNPGKKVALVFGVSHEFKDDLLKQASLPVLTSVKFNNLLAKFEAITMKEHDRRLCKLSPQDK